jgi:hypothetical protein
MSCGNYTTVCGTCSCNPCCGQGACDPANVIHQGTCTDPGTATVLRHLLGLDQQFCKRRLIPAGSGGFLVARQTPNGWDIKFSTAPTVALEAFLAVQGVAFGQVLVQQSDSVMRAMNPPVTANLVLGTNAAGQAMWIPIPAATVPDPLTVADLTVTNLATINNLAVTGTPVFSGLGTGALVSFLGLDAANNVIKGTPATTGTQVASFFEAPTSPSATTPNSGATAGNLLTIGNLLFDSVGTAGGSLFTATNSQTLTCLTAGVYIVDFGGQVTWTGGSSGQAAIQLLVNGVVVNNGNARPDATITSILRNANLWGQNMRRFVVGDTVQLQLGATSGTNTQVYEARVNFTRTGA